MRAAYFEIQHLVKPAEPDCPVARLINGEEATLECSHRSHAEPGRISGPSQAAAPVKKAAPKAAPAKKVAAPAKKASTKKAASK